MTRIDHTQRHCRFRPGATAVLYPSGFVAFRRTWWTLWHRGGLALLAAALLGAHGTLAAAAQAIGTAPQDNVVAAQSPADETGAAKDLERRPAEATAELNAISTPETLAAGAPPATSEEDLLERRARLGMLVGLYRMEIEREGDLAELKARRAALDQGETAWPPPLPGPPYSCVAVDPRTSLRRSNGSCTWPALPTG